MNPFFMAVINAVLSLKRICPGCKREQVVPPGKRQESVSCKFCSANIPPRK